MIVLILGLLDILAGLSIFSLGFSWGPVVISFFGVYLIVKSLPTLKSIASITDLCVAVIFFAAVGGYSQAILSAISAIWLIQKGIISFF